MGFTTSTSHGLLSNLLSPHYHILKKPVDITKYTPDGIIAPVLNTVTDNFKELFWGLSPKEKSRPTIQKQCSNNTSRYHILQQDLTFILHLLDKAVEKANSCYFLKVLLTLNQDSSLMDVSKVPLGVVGKEGKLTFLQLCGLPTLSHPDAIQASVVPL